MKRSAITKRLRGGKWLTFCGLLILQGCGVLTAPGFDYADAGQRTTVPLGQYVAGDPNNPPQGVIVPITPDLVETQVLARPRDIAPDVKALFDKAKPYTVGPGDVVGIVVYDHPDLLPSAGAVISQSADPTGISAAPGFIVSSEGDISFPYLGRFKVGGLTEIQASDRMAQLLGKYIKNPQVTFRIASFRSRRAYVEGEVRTPGMQIFTDVPMTLPPPWATAVLYRSHATTRRSRSTSFPCRKWALTPARSCCRATTS